MGRYSDQPRLSDAGYLILAIACMMPEYICVEKACSIYYSDSRNVKQLSQWVTPKIVEEMREYRAKGMSLRDIGYLLGMNASHVCRYLSGRRVPVIQEGQIP